MAPLTLHDRAPLTNTSSSIPKLGFGVYQLYGKSCQKAVLDALEAGYRHIDSAQLYRNEADVGAAIQQSPIQRQDIFITTKIRQSAGSFEKSYQSCMESIEKVSGKDGYVDLLLIHIPGTGRESREELWGVLEKLYAEGRAKAIGVSNYRPQHIEEMKEYAKVWPPHVNQIELHPWCQQREIVQYCEDKNIVLAAYSPLSCGDHLNDPTLGAIADKYNKSPAQILIRFALQKNWVPLPKSGNTDRIKQNANVFDFALDQGDMKTLDGLDRGRAGALFPANVK
ncbi:hypothetical protein J3458_007164 [Metarhizium acridum]|uniref:Aldo-keto reductase, putative n=1 Tax=Metarhizium acridum (strain CQMa 102) TaxID=655827 RepID=E9DSM3_METAQ|nr:aldo-keto reductase, putative [Metarhizium acridum CQMa 102]EFY93383.1 aldo-keto reductase, putative [Metarhizium acridum CQMa 102]KAG8416585.1 hypothetical protein J3458_007164 [Metarhizium acridum]